MKGAPIRLSILVATKDRYETLFDCIKGLLINYDRPDVEIIVRDNSAYAMRDEFNERFHGQANVVYQHDPAPVSQSENYELGMRLARGEFVTMIGDDDGIAGGLFEIISWMERHSIDALTPGFSVYLWPGVPIRFLGGNPDGWLKLEGCSAPTIIDVADERQAVLACGCTSLERLPRLYYGIVRRSSLTKLEEKAGAFFPGPSPDMANAFALSYSVTRMATCKFPIFIAGNSRKSNAGLGLRRKHVGEIPELPFLPNNTAECWNPKIPFFWSAQTIWCQSAFAAAKAMGRASEFEASNNYRALYARILVFQPRYVRRLKSAFAARHTATTSFEKMFDAFATLLAACAIWSARIANFVARKLGLRPTMASGAAIEGVRDIMDATRRVDEALGGADLSIWA